MRRGAALGSLRIGAIVGAAVAVVALVGAPASAEPAALTAPAGRAASSASATYVGSQRCQPCHPAVFQAWKDAPHSHTLHAPSDSDKARLAESLMCAGRPVRLAIGLKRHVRFVAPDESGVDRVLPCRWNRVSDSWDTVGAEPGPVFVETCAWCHQTGAEHAKEDGVGCEACHGPGSAHVADPEHVDSFAFPASKPELAASVCGSCHLQGGLSKDGLTFPDGFRPGSDLRLVFKYDWSGLDAAKGDHHAQREIRTVLAGPSKRRVCLDCHDPHRQTATAHATQPQGPLCAECHVNGSAQLRSGREAVCPVCEL